MSARPGWKVPSPGWCRPEATSRGSPGLSIFRSASAAKRTFFTCSLLPITDDAPARKRIRRAVGMPWRSVDSPCQLRLNLLSYHSRPAARQGSNRSPIPDGGSMSDRESIRKTLVELVEADTGEKPASFDDTLKLREGLGLDSVDVVSIVAQVERRYRIRLSQEELETLVTVGDVLNLLQAKIAGNSSSSSEPSTV